MAGRHHIEKSGLPSARWDIGVRPLARRVLTIADPFSVRSPLPPEHGTPLALVNKDTIILCEQGHCSSTNMFVRKVVQLR